MTAAPPAADWPGMRLGGKLVKPLPLIVFESGAGGGAAFGSHDGIGAEGGSCIAGSGPKPILPWDGPLAGLAGNGAGSMGGGGPKLGAAGSGGGAVGALMVGAGAAPIEGKAGIAGSAGGTWGEVIVAPHCGHGPVTPAMCRGTVSGAWQVLQ